MIDPPQILQTKPQLTAVIPLTIPKDQIREVMGPGITELMSTLAAQGVKPTGTWFDSWDFEICVPTNVPVAAAGRVRPSQWPAMKVARAIHHGDYEGLSDSWEEFMGWIEEQGHDPAQDQYQCYVVGPETSDDPADWRTELFKPIL